MGCSQTTLSTDLLPWLLRGEGGGESTLNTCAAPIVWSAAFKCAVELFPLVATFVRQGGVGVGSGESWDCFVWVGCLVCSWCPSCCTCFIEGLGTALVFTRLFSPPSSGWALVSVTVGGWVGWIEGNHAVKLDTILWHCSFVVEIVFIQGCRFSIIFCFFRNFGPIRSPPIRFPLFSIFSYFIFLFLNFLSLFVFIFCETARTRRFSVIFAKVQWHPYYIE